MPKIRPPVKTHGGKFYLAPWVISHFPVDYENMHYIEPFIGGGSVLLQKNRSCSELIGDADNKIVFIWNQIRDNLTLFVKRLRRFEYSKETFESAKLAVGQSEIELAINEYVVRRMSRGGLRKSFAWSKRLRGGVPGDLNGWLTSLKNLKAVSDRIQCVGIHHDSYEWCFDKETSKTLVYLDPPYLKTTRQKGATSAYEHEMSDADHEVILRRCLGSRAKLVVSGYSSPLYDETLKEWRCVFKEVANHSSQKSKKQKKRECLWMNY